MAIYQHAKFGFERKLTKAEKKRCHQSGLNFMTNGIKEALKFDASLPSKGYMQLMYDNGVSYAQASFKGAILEMTDGYVDYPKGGELLAGFGDYV